MRNENRQILLNGSMSQALASVPQPLDNMTAISVQAFWTGATPVGTFGIQVSDLLNPTTNPADWTLLSDPAPVAVTGNQGSAQLNVGPVGFKWCRAVYGFTSGSGTMQMWFNGKGGS